MKTEKYLGIWMDHASAHLIESHNGLVATKTINSAFNHQVKEHILEKSEKEMHYKENDAHLAFYKEIGKSILAHEDVLLFGPTDAKTELLNLIRKDHHFDKINISVEPSDKMTVNQEHAFVRDYYLNH